VKKYMYCLFLTVIITNVNLLQASWARIAERPEGKHETYQQSVANTAEQRLDLLKENRAKHAQIAQEAKAGQYPKGTNFEVISAQKQEVIDQPAQEYFWNSWFRPSSESVGENAAVVNNQQGQQFWQQNKPLIKENYRLANKLADAQTRQNTLQNAAQIRLSTNPLDLIQTGKQVWNLGSDKGSQTAVGKVYYNDAPIGSTYYKNVKNPKTGQYEIRRSGISNQDAFMPESGIETVQQYADRYKIANNAIKPTDPAALTAQLQQENAALANTAIPNAQSISPSRMFSLGSSLYSNYGAVKPLHSNTVDLYTKGNKIYNNFDINKGLAGNFADAYSTYLAPNNPAELN